MKESKAERWDQEFRARGCSIAFLRCGPWELIHNVKLNIEMQVSGGRELQVKEMLNLLSSSLILVILQNVFLVAQGAWSWWSLDNSYKAVAIFRNTENGYHMCACMYAKWLQSCLTLGNPMDSMQYCSVIPFSPCLQSFLASGSLMSQFFAWGGLSIGVSASASVLPMNIQDRFPLWWNGWIFLQSKGLSRIFSNTTVQKHQFFSAQLSL